MIIHRCALPLLLCTLALVPATASEEAAVLPGGANWMLHLDLAALNSGATGAWLQDFAAREEVSLNLRRFAVLTGVDVLEDLETISLFGSDVRYQHAVLAIRGTLDRERLIALAQVAKDYQRSEREGLVVHSWIDEQRGSRAYGVFPEDGLLILGADEERVRQAAAQLPDWQPPEGAGGELLLLLGAVEELDRFPKLQAEAAMLRHLRDAQLRIGQEGEALRLSLHLRAKREQSATRMRQLLVGVRALGLLNGVPVKQLPPGRVESLLERIRFDQEASTVLVELSLPVAELRELVAALRGSDGP